jgi:hypothetical protein
MVLSDVRMCAVSLEGLGHGEICFQIAVSLRVVWGGFFFIKFVSAGSSSSLCTIAKLMD